jgi:S-disulfanyl-L-cysteine oxidoreductase SoxD
MGSAPGIPTTAIRQTENALVDLLGFTVRDVLRSQIAPVKEPDMPPRPLPHLALPFTALAVAPSVALATAAVAIVVAASTAFAQTAEGPSFTAEQVERGRAAYSQNCQDCHGSTLDNGEFGGPPLKGGYFRNHWGAGSVADLTGYAKALMPPDRPGRLSDQTYTDLIAFLLSNNGYAPGSRELPSDAAAQQKMSLKK